MLAGSLASFLFVLPGAAFGVRFLGVAIGLLLATVGVLTTKTERKGQDWFYTPNSYLGLAIASLILGRIAYRVWTMLRMSEDFGRDFVANQILSGNPVGRVMILAVLVYLATYNTAVLARCHWKLAKTDA